MAFYGPNSVHSLVWCGLHIVIFCSYFLKKGINSFSSKSFFKNSVYCTVNSLIPTSVSYLPITPQLLSRSSLILVSCEFFYCSIVSLGKFQKKMH